jgi:hypothetical protein
MSVGPVAGGGVTSRCTSSPRNVLKIELKIGIVVGRPAAAAIGRRAAGR